MPNPGDKEYCHTCEIWFIHTAVKTSCPMCNKNDELIETEKVYEGIEEELGILKEKHKTYKNRLTDANTIIQKIKDALND